MKPCLEDSELLHLLAADAGDNADHRQHLTECSRCAARYEEAVREAGMITSALAHAADHLISRKSAAEASAYEPFGDRFRLAAIFSGAAAFGGAAAFALLLTLGWRPVSASNRLAQVASNTPAMAGLSNENDLATHHRLTRPRQSTILIVSMRGEQCIETVKRTGPQERELAPD